MLENVVKRSEFGYTKNSAIQKLSIIIIMSGVLVHWQQHKIYIYISVHYFISGPNLKKLSVFLIKDHDTESNAFSESINNNNPRIFLFSV